MMYTSKSALWRAENRVSLDSTEVLLTQHCQILSGQLYQPIMVTGDFNKCLEKYPEHKVFHVLRTMGFRPLTSEATHLKGGHIDQAWLREGDMGSTIQLYSPYYTCKDHDALLISVFDRRTEQGKYSMHCLEFSL